MPGLYRVYFRYSFLSVNVISKSLVMVKIRANEFIFLLLFYIPPAARGRLANPTWGEYRVLTFEWKTQGCTLSVPFLYFNLFIFLREFGLDLFFSIYMMLSNKSNNLLLAVDYWKHESLFDIWSSQVFGIVKPSAASAPAVFGPSWNLQPSGCLWTRHKATTSPWPWMLSEAFWMVWCWIWNSMK